MKVLPLKRSVITYCLIKPALKDPNAWPQLPLSLKNMYLFISRRGLQLSHKSIRPTNKV